MNLRNQTLLPNGITKRLQELGMVDVKGEMVALAGCRRPRSALRSVLPTYCGASPPVALRHPLCVRPEDEAFVVGRRAQGASMREIADELTERGPAPGGGRWQVSVIQRILARNPLTSRRAT